MTKKYKRPTKCQECGGKIGLFIFGHTAGEHFCSGECQMADDKRTRGARVKEALKA